MFSRRVLCDFTYLVDWPFIDDGSCVGTFFPLNLPQLNVNLTELVYRISLVASLSRTQQDLGSNLNPKDVLTRGAADTPKNDIVGRILK
jgi:hypothetical protein